jgi:hypothetical protein
VLCALTFEPDAFAAGVSYFGVADAEAPALETHKFESRYLDSLIGPHPDRADLYRARSSIHFVDQLERPLLLLQGLDDESSRRRTRRRWSRCSSAKASRTRISRSKEKGTASAARRTSPADELEPLEVVTSGR